MQRPPLRPVQHLEHHGRTGHLGRLLVATTNPGKLREMTRSLDGLPVEILSLADVGSPGAVEETGATFAANAEEGPL